MELGLSGKAAIVTGGSAGIGRAAAKRLAQEGAKVAVCARRADVLQRAVDDIREETGGDVVAIAGDVSLADDVERLVTSAIERFGRLDVLVNNAGKSAAGAFDSVTDAAWQEDLDLKLFAAIRAIRLAVPHMIAAGGGSIVNVVNIGAKAPAAKSVPTSVSRAAGIALTKALSKELAEHRIRVNAVCIGQIKSDQWVRRATALGEPLDRFYDRMASESRIPLGRIGEAEEVADLIAFLTSDRSMYITGVAINMDGGLSAVV
jgi:NAD(P)-dependent dehydrogenase (short-subunit alcohol dehydrogenase family)